MKGKKKITMTFKQAVEATNDVASCYQKGLQALGAHSSKIELAETTKCEGSVNIDDCTRAIYPQASRWDYCFSYKGSVYFVEVHTANTSEVRPVLKKLQWLKDWLNSKAPEINKLKNKNNPYYWVQSNGFNITRTSKQYRTMVQAGIKPIAKIKLT